MLTSICTILGVLLLISEPASAKWRAANADVEAAARTPRIAAALAATDRMDRAILSRDANEFAAVFADDPVVNNPFTGSRARKTRSGIL